MPVSVDENRMSPLVKRLRSRIVAEKGFSCFAETVGTEQVLFAYSQAVGVPIAQLLREWSGQVDYKLEAGTPERTAWRSGDDDDGEIEGRRYACQLEED